MCAVQDANSSPWTTNTAVTAILGQRVEGLPAALVGLARVAGRRVGRFGHTQMLR